MTMQSATEHGHYKISCSGCGSSSDARTTLPEHQAKGFKEHTKTNKGFQTHCSSFNNRVQSISKDRHPRFLEHQDEGCDSPGYHGYDHCRSLGPIWRRTAHTPCRAFPAQRLPTIMSRCSRKHSEAKDELSTQR